MHNILVLPGSHWQIPLIKKIKEMGYSVVNINPYENSPAFEHSDVAIRLDIMEVDKCVKAVKEFGIKAVVSDECDIATPVVANIAERLGVRGIGIDKAELFTNKYKMREFTRNNGFAYPEYELVHTEQEAEEFLRKLEQKIIIKPIDSNSSRGVFTINNEKELKLKFNEALKHSIAESTVICERYIEGVEFTVDGIMTNAGHSTLAISQKKHYDYNENIAYSLRFSHESSNYDYALLKRRNDELINKSGLPFGLTHVEYKYEKGEFILIEMGARGGGNLISANIVPIISGVDNYKEYINMALGNISNHLYHISSEYIKREAILYFFDLPSSVAGKCTIRDIKGIDYLENNPQIIKYALNFNIGDTIYRAENDSKRIGYYIAYGENKEELDSIISEVDRRFELIIDK